MRNWNGLWPIARVAALSLSLVAPATAQNFSSSGPAPAGSASSPPAPLFGCQYMPNGTTLSEYGRFGCTINAAGAINVNVVGGGGGAAGSVGSAGTNGTQAQSVQGISGGVPQAVTPGPGTVTQPVDIAVPATTATQILATTARKYLSIINVTGTAGFCRITYSGITPTATRGDPLNSAAVAGGQGGTRTFENGFVPTGTVSAYCSVASSLSVIEGN